MIRFRSLSSKFIFIGIVILTFFAIYIYSEFRFIQHMKGNATAINLAGRERLLISSMAYTARSMIELPPSINKEMFRKGFERSISKYEEALYGLRDGSERLGLNPIPKDGKESIAHLNTLIELWQNTQKPTILHIMKLPPERKNEMCGLCHSAVRDNLGKIESLVKSLEVHTESDIKNHEILRFYMFGFLFLSVVFIIFYTNKSILKPVQGLKNTIEEMEKGNFDVRVNIKTRDEIGNLGNAYNSMAETLKFLLDEKTRHIKEVWALADASNILFAITPTEDIYGAICNIAIRDFDLPFVWIGLIEEGSYDVKIVAHAGFEEGYLSIIKVTWDDSPTGMGPSGMAIKTKTPIVIHDYESDPAITSWREEALKRGYRSSIAMPIIFSDGKVIGVLKFYSGEPQFFTRKRFDILQVFTNQSSTAIENRWLIEGLEEKVKERTKELEDAKMLADNASKAKSDFLANMSHELRTPLNSIMGFSQVMLEGMTGDMTEQQREFMKDIYNSGKHLLSLIEDILDLSKVEAGKIELELTEFSVKDLIERSMTLFKEKVMKHNIKLTAEIEPDAGQIEADERRIRQVIFNLLSNAMKFTPDGGSVMVRARRVQSSELRVWSVNNPPSSPLNLRGEKRGVNLKGGEGGLDFIEISVEDTGIGISPEDQKRLFQPFQQLETTLTKKYPGTGLGLNLCKKFVELHGGRIWIESEAGKGSKFIFIIPIRQNT